VFTVFNSFNEGLAVKLTKGVGSMVCAYLFFAWSLLPLVFPGMLNMVSYVSQSIIQLVLLSIIMVGQDIGGRTNEKRAVETHNTVIEELVLVKEELEIAREERALLQELIEDLHQRHIGKKIENHSCIRSCSSE
jgi:hypothetical protein